MVTIRQETSSDYDEVYELVKQSFATASHADGTEADYWQALRTKEAFIPELSFVAETGDGEIVGQVVLYKTDIQTQNGPHETLVLSPLCVHPGFFRQGIARALVEYALGKAAAMGYASVFLCGEPTLYRKLGFIPSYEFAVYHKDDPKAAWCMGRELVPCALTNISGTIDIV